jgi:ketosteroid isomerase-like protein
MSQENVEVVRAALEAWNRADWDAMGDFYDPGVIWRGPEGWPEPGPFFGREAVMRQFEQLRETWDSDRLQPTSAFIYGADRVVVTLDWRGEGHGPALNIEVTNVFTFRKRKVVYQEVFWDRAAALEAVGLSEQDAHADS